MGISIALVPWIIREIFQAWKDRSKASDESLKANTAAINELRLTMKLVEAQLKNVADATGSIAKMQRDLDVAHAHLRIVAPHLYNPPARS